MSNNFSLRVRAYKEYLRKLIGAIKGSNFQMKLVRPKAKEFKAYLDDFYSGLACANTARDIHALTTAGSKYDVEFHFLYAGITSIDFVDRYSETFLRSLVERVFAPTGVYQCLGEIKRQNAALA